MIPQLHELQADVQTAYASLQEARAALVAALRDLSSAASFDAIAVEETPPEAMVYGYTAAAARVRDARAVVDDRRAELVRLATDLNRREGVIP